MIVRQKIYEEDGRTILRNTFDCSEAIDMAKQVSDTGGRGKNIIPLGFIPPEYWQFDPWLIEAKKAQQGGDKAAFIRLVKKFFELHPAFAVKSDHGQKYWKGGLILD
jgi:hypothetical protein